MARDSSTTQFSLRLPEEIHAKVRVIAAYRAVSINAVVTESVIRLVQEWEEKHGVVVIPEVE